MLQIDDTIIPLDEEDERVIAELVRRRLDAGEIPAIGKDDHGRVAVLNPDPVQTVHHVPDDLRTPLRRGFAATKEGSTTVPPQRILEELREGEGRLYACVVELESEYPRLAALLAGVARLRPQFPEMMTIMAGSLTHLVDRLGPLLEPEGASLVLEYDDARGRVEIPDPAALARLAPAEREVPDLSAPFFAQLRLFIGKDRKPLPVNLDSLARLHAQFGHGELDEIDVGHGKVERVAVIDLPTKLIRAVQFRSDRGMQFHGIVRDGQEILSRHFGEHQLEHRWVPWRSLEAILKQVPGREVERIELSKVQALRINTFTGHIAFLSNLDRNQLSLQEAARVMLNVVPDPEEGTVHTVPLDRVIVSEGGAAHFERLQETLREHLYARLLGEELTHRLKLERYARRLTIGAIGPLAGQTLKLVRRYGLERLIDPESFHYLCDTADDVADHHLVGERFEAHFQTLLEYLGNIVSTSSGETIRVDDITHKLPTLTEWIDRERVRLEEVGPRQLDAAQQEVLTLSEFIHHEFRRHYTVDAGEREFFQQLDTCRAAHLLSRWLADYRAGAYGPPLPEGAHPDMVFLGTARDREQIDAEYFLPSLTCADLFREPEVRRLFDKGDYEFSVFLERYLRQAEARARKSGKDHAPLSVVEALLEAVGKRAQAELNDLQQAVQHLDVEGSPEYDRLVKEEEAAYRQRYQEFVRDRDTISRAYDAAADSYQDLLVSIGRQLPLDSDPDPAWSDGETDPAVAFSREFVRAARKADNRKLLEAGRLSANATSELNRRANTMKRYVAFLGELAEAHHAWQLADQEQHYRQAAEQAAGGLAERVHAVKRMDTKGREGYAPRIASQLKNAEAECAKLRANLTARARQPRRAVNTMLGAVNRLATQLREFAPAAEPHVAQTQADHVAALARRMGDMAGSLRENSTRLLESCTQFGQVAIRLRQAAAQVHKLQVETRALAAVEQGQAPEPPPVQPLLARGSVGPKPEAAKASYQKLHAQLDDWTRRLKEMSRAPETVQQAHQALSDYADFHARAIELERQASRKVRLRQGITALAERVKLMEAELADLPRRVREQHMPARKELLVRMFIPEAERTLGHARHGKQLVRELGRLDMGAIRDRYLDRAVFRRFAGRQWVSGAYIATNTASTEGQRVTNVPAALHMYGRTVQHNVTKHHPDWAAHYRFDEFQPMEPALIWDMIQQQHGTGEGVRYGFVVLPATLPIDQVVRLMNQKDQLYQGLPLLVLVFVGKFSKTLLHEDHRLREQYFDALRHNVILNIDGAALVDNPASICERLLSETLGSAHDVDTTEPLPSADTVAAAG